MEEKGPTQIVHRIEDGMDRMDVIATTYQMRNFYRQFADGFFTAIDVMNYIQHHQIVKMCKKGMDILDVCCGRGLLLPMLRYYVKDLGSYTGVDIRKENATFQKKRVTDGKPLEDGYYPFPVHFVHSNVAEMSKHISRTFDFIIYTSSIEHMHKDMGQASLQECRKLSHPGTMLFITCPNTPEDGDGYQTQYRAHVYEWKRSELISGLKNAGFSILTEFGLLMDKRTLRNEMEEIGALPIFERLEQCIPTEWLAPMLSPLFPYAAKEIGFLARA